jgi:secondary thiamine-phosphate synthase enzyme
MSRGGGGRFRAPREHLGHRRLAAPELVGMLDEGRRQCLADWRIAAGSGKVDTWETGRFMLWIQRQITLAPRKRGFHLVTDEILAALPELRSIQVGLLHLFLQHTSASLVINENADADVRRDLETALNQLAPEDFPYVHTIEGPDDMPAHVKSALLGCDVTIPVAGGRLQLGTWQGVYLCEHRNRAGRRNVIATLWGQQVA